MVALRLFWKGFGHIWTKVKTRVSAEIFPLSSFVRLVLIMVFAVWLGLAIVAIAFGLAWLFLALVTSAEEARSIAILALSTALTSMAGVIVLLSGQAILARFLSRRWGVPFKPTPNPLLATSTLIAFVVGCVCLVTQGLEEGAILSLKIAAGAMVTSLVVLLARALCATPDALRSVQKIGFDQLSAHQKLRVLAARNPTNQDTPP